jgi:hypothetical protein
MVAPVPPKHSPSPALRRAHELVAATLLEGKPSGEIAHQAGSPARDANGDRNAVPSSPTSRKWRAWTFAAWVALLAAALMIYLISAL